MTRQPSDCADSDIVVVVVVVATAAQADDVMFGESGVVAGTTAAHSPIVVLMSTVGLDSVLRLSESLRARGIRFLDAPIRTHPLQFYATIEGWVTSSHEEHPAIIVALSKRDAKKTKSLMEHHISEGADRLIDTLEKRGLWSDTPDG